MPYCAYLGCKNHTSKGRKRNGVIFHRFPTNPAILAEWVRIVREMRKDKKWSPLNSSVICNDHFDKKDKYATKCDRIYLTKTAIPIAPKREPGEKRSPSPSEENDGASEDGDKVSKKTPENSESFDPLDDDLETQSNSPKDADDIPLDIEKKLKSIKTSSEDSKRMKHMLEAHRNYYLRIVKKKEDLVNEYRNRIKCLRRKVTYLEHENEILIETLKEMD